MRSTPEVVIFSPNAPEARENEGYLEEGFARSARSSEAIRETWRRLVGDGEGEQCTSPCTPRLERR